MSFAKDAISSLIESDQTKEYVHTAVKSTVPTLVQFGLGFAVPFLSPIIIAASSHLILKGLEIAGDKIKVADDKIQQYKGQTGTKGFLAKMASPALGVLKKVFPATEKELYEALTDSNKLKQFLSEILENPKKKQEFEESLKKFLTGKYGDFEEFQRNVKDTLGIEVDRLALEAYTEFTSIIYNSEILNKIITLSGTSEQIRINIEESIKEIHKDFEDKYGEIKNEIISLRDTFYGRYGLYRLTPNYFEDYVDTKQDMERWKEGFSFQSLSSIKQNKEFRRDKILEEIKKRIEGKNRQLIVAGSGTSKSTILMEIICDYYDNGYEILWNRGDAVINNGNDIIDFIGKLLNDGNRVLVAVDNVHDERRSAIFYAMDQLSLHNKSKNLRFILTARLPEYDLLVDPQRLLIQVQKEYRGSLQRFRDESNRKDSLLKYEIPFFTHEDIRGFIRKYREEEMISSTTEEEIVVGSEKIYKDTNGHPIMVKFAVIGEGLRKDVEDRYLDYLIDQTSKIADPSKIQTILVCSLLDIAGLQITDRLLNDMKIKKYAKNLRHALLYHYPDGGIWKTIHPRWDLELLSFLFTDIDDEDITDQRQRYLKKAIASIFSIKDEQITVSIITTMYDIAADTVDGVTKIPIDVVDNVIENQMHTSDYLSNETKVDLYAVIIANDYYKLNRFNDVVDKCNKALSIEPNNIYALNNKAAALDKLGQYQESIPYYDKALSIEPNNIYALNNKAAALDKLGQYQESIPYYDKALAIDPNHVYALYNKAAALDKLGQYQEAIECYDKALYIDPNHVYALNNKAAALDKLGQYQEAITYYDKALYIDPNHVYALYNKGSALAKLAKFQEAIECYDKVLAIDPNHVYALNSKDIILEYMGLHEESTN